VPADLTSTWAALDGTRLFEHLTADLNEHFKLPKDLVVAHRECGAVNAYYEPAENRIALCYELLSSIMTLARDNRSLSEAEVLQRIRATWMFIFFHELGHALIDYYDIPIAGNEEDAVDNFSTLSLLQTGDAEVATLAAGYWGASATGMYDELDFSDEHALNEQRFYNILCLVYGSDPQARADIVASGDLPSERAATCQPEYQRVRAAWTRLLGSWVQWD
jgi:hypothetical protein